MENPNNAVMAHIQHLTQQINLAYQAMRDERQQLAIWEENQEFSLLGEIELLTTDLQGYAGQVLTGTCKQPNQVLATLQTTKPFEIVPISDWYLTLGAEYPQICRYIELLDYLRLMLLEYLGQRVVKAVA